MHAHTYINVHTHIHPLTHTHTHTHTHSMHLCRNVCIHILCAIHSGHLAGWPQLRPFHGSFLLPCKINVFSIQFCMQVLLTELYPFPSTLLQLILWYMQHVMYVGLIQRLHFRWPINVISCKTYKKYCVIDAGSAYVNSWKSTCVQKCVLHDIFFALLPSILQLQWKQKYFSLSSLCHHFQRCQTVVS